MKDIFSKEIQARNPKPIQNWVLTLRDNNSKHYINFGSIKNPKWQMIVSPKLPKETITLIGDDLEVFNKMLAMLDEIEDVQNVYHNVEL